MILIRMVKKNEPDGQVDFIAICFRDANFPGLDGSGYSGIAGLTGFRGVFGSGTSQLNLDGKMISAKNLLSDLGSETFQRGILNLHDGLGTICHEFGHYMFGTTHYVGEGIHGIMDGAGTGVMSSFERIRLNWLQAIPVNNAESDVMIPDAISTGVVRRINIPNSSEYFLIDNHQRISFYESSWTKSNGGPLVSPGTGMIISHCSNAGTYGWIDIESAFGRWNWKKSGSLYIYPFDVDAVNKISGEDKQNLRGKNTTQGVKDHPDCNGSSHDFFSIYYNRVFSPWSNPSTYPDNTNLCVELIQFDQYNNAHVNFYTQNAYLASPSKPQNLQVAVSSSNHPELTWEANTEPDKSFYKVYKYNNSEFGWQFLGNTATTYYQDVSVSYCEPGQYCPQRTVRYRVTCMDTQNKESVPSDSVMTSVRGFAQEKKGFNTSIVDIPKEYKLSANYPNPFNPSTIINYSVKEAGLVKIKVFDILGSEVAELVNETKEAGNFAVEFKAANLPSGVYLYTMQVNNFSSSQKMLLLK